jgi:redox-sensitive bicupin YhaK (pirin superfamily)
MSVQPMLEPVCSGAASEEAITNVIEGRPRDLGGLSVRRVLPAALRRTVGPFIFFDHMGPAVFAPGTGIDVRPHPHVNLATITYLFEGAIDHRDSLGSFQTIRPGDVNWMTAGRGIVHSERTPQVARKTEARVHGLQLWVALPTSQEETAPAFVHYPGATLPEVDQRGTRVRVLAGTAYGLSSPVETLSPLFYLDATLPAGGELALPADHEERAVYVVEGALRCGDEAAEPGRMLVFKKGANVVLRTQRSCRLVLLGGAPLDGPRYIDWNFVSSSKERIEQAKRDWREGRFPKVPGDEVEFIPLPG